MAANKQIDQKLLKKLKKQVRISQRKENQVRNKLRTALEKIRKMARSYKKKLAGKIRIMRGRFSDVQSSTYAKLAADISRQIENSIEKKRQAIATALSRIEKKQLAKLTKSMKKRKKARKGTKTPKKSTNINKKRRQSLKRK